MKPAVQVGSVVDELGPATGAMAAGVIAADVAANPLADRPGKVVIPPPPPPPPGGVSWLLFGAAIVAGLLTLGFIAIGVTEGGTTSAAATPAPTAAPTATPTTAAAAAPQTGTLASPAVGSPIFVSFSNPLAEVVITGFGAPPPGTHLDHVSTFRMQATGTGLAYVWILTNPGCGTLSGAQARAASVTWDHSTCTTLESAARISVTVIRAPDLGPNGAPDPAAAYFTYAQTARAGDSFATDALPKNVSLQYFGPAAVRPTAAATAIAGTAVPAAPAAPSGSRLPWVPLALDSLVACAALVWRSGVASVLRG